MPKEAGVSHGSLILPITETGGTSLAGSLEGGPFSAPTAIAGTVDEAFTGGPACGVTEGKKEKPVKSGSFFGSGVAIG